LSYDAIRDFQPGESVVQVLQPTGNWVVPVYQDGRPIALVDLDQNLEAQSAAQLNPPGTVNVFYVTPFYETEPGDLWFIDVPPLVRLILIKNGNDERMALFWRGPSDFYQDLFEPVVDSFVSADEMMSILKRAVYRACTSFFVLRHC
jgi:hypothetical protein